ncbi:sodium:calcium antiporter [Helicobacter pylori]|nr:sodium:calcium antiporter [Helicobacter pylori]
MTESLREKKLIQILGNIIPILDSLLSFVADLKKELDFIEMENDGVINDANLHLFDLNLFLSNNINIYYSNSFQIDDVKSDHLNFGVIESFVANLFFMKDFLKNEYLSIELFKKIKNADEDGNLLELLEDLIPLYDGETSPENFKENHSYASLVFVYTTFLMEIVLEKYRIYRFLKLDENQKISDNLKEEIKDFFVQAGLIEHYFAQKIRDLHPQYRFRELLLKPIRPSWFHEDKDSSLEKELYEKYFLETAQWIKEIESKSNHSKND